MFGHSDDQQAMMGSPTVQNPSMLDNVSHEDFHATDDPATLVPPQDPATQVSSVPPVSSLDPSMPPAGSFQTADPAAVTPLSDAPADDQQTEQPQVSEHPITTDNPFAGDPLATTDPVSNTDDTTLADDNTAGADSPTDPADTNNATSLSGPVEPPIVTEEANDTTTDANLGEETSNYLSAIADEAQNEVAEAEQKIEQSSDAEEAPSAPEVPAFSLTAPPQSDTNDVPPVDLEKLAHMKKQALTHLEPLADKLDGTPEDTFKTTMMMIQANDNHTLLEKALKAAKDIKDDKERAQAMLDIINEINYFSQQ